MIAAIVNAGDALTAATLLAIVLGGIAMFRDKRRSAWRDQAEALGATVQRLEEELDEVKTAAAALRLKVTDLESRPDYRDLFQLIEKHDARTVTAIELIQAHDARTVSVLERISDHLAPAA